MKNLPRNLLILAALLAIISSTLILASNSEVHESIINADGSRVENIYPQSWYQTQGAWGVAILIIFAILYALPYYLFGKDYLGANALFALVALILTFLAGFSIGGFYLPAAAALLIAFLLLGIAHFRNL